MNNKISIADIFEEVLDSVVNQKRKLQNRPIILVDTESDKEVILSCIDSILKQEFPECAIHVFRIDLATIQSMNELSYAVFHKIYESQDENIKHAKDFSRWIEDVNKAEGVIGAFGMAPVVSINQKDKNVNKGYGIFVFDNLDKANDQILEGVKDMYHDGRDCLIPYGWEFVSFCHHGAKIWDTRLACSCMRIDYSEEQE